MLPMSRTSQLPVSLRTPSTPPSADEADAPNPFCPLSGFDRIRWLATQYVGVGHTTCMIELEAEMLNGGANLDAVAGVADMQAGRRIEAKAPGTTTRRRDLDVLALQRHA
jgi:hypothetical protein